MVRLDEDGRCAEARIGLCNAGDRPVFAADAQRIPRWPANWRTRIKEAAELVQKCDRSGPVAFMPARIFQRHIAGVLTAPRPGGGERAGAGG